MISLRQQSHQGADQLQREATCDDVIEQARFRKAVPKSVATADRGEFASAANVRRTFGKWGMDVKAWIVVQGTDRLRPSPILHRVGGSIRSANRRGAHFAAQPASH